MTFEVIEQNMADAIPSVVIIDDEFTSRTILDRVIRSIQENIIVTSFDNPVEAMTWIRSNQPDLVLVDYMMNGMTGLDVVKQIRSMSFQDGVQIVVVTSMEDRHIRYQVLDAGASDFINKPIDPYECRTRCRNMLTLRIQQKIILGRSVSLEKEVVDATKKIHQREMETLFRLAKAGEHRDADTGNHILRMAKYSRLIAETLGLPQENCDLIENAAPMHDIGKIGIPDHILLKQARLTAEEFSIMKNHAAIGFQILQHSPSKYLSMGAEIALRHHEKFDGSGYPDGLKGTSIPLEARIVAVADVYDALTSARPYKKAWTNKEAETFLTASKGIHFDPDCVDAFLSQRSQATLIQLQLLDSH